MRKGRNGNVTKMLLIIIKFFYLLFLTVKINLMKVRALMPLMVIHTVGRHLISWFATIQAVWEAAVCRPHQVSSKHFTKTK